MDLYSYRILDGSNQAPISRVVEAIYMAIEQNVNIINMSFGMNTYSNALKEAIQAAEDAGILIIASAGNTGNQGVQYPAAYEEVVAVGAVNKDGTVEDYSAKGKEVEIVAPGELVRTTGFIGTENVTSGTSLAAPQVAAVASLIWQKDPDVSAEFVRGLLDESANLYGEMDEYGNGLVDAEYALSHYDEYKEKYEKNKKLIENNNMISKQILQENDKAITTFSDTECVEGCWSKNDHVQMISEDYYCVRAGARFSDLSDDIVNNKLYNENNEYRNQWTTNSYDLGKGDSRKFEGTSVNPWWHGYTVNYESTNYIKATIYATRIGDAIGYCDTINAASNDFNYNHANNMATDLEDLYSDNQKGWNFALDYTKHLANGAANKQTNSTGFRRAFVWGMAIHIATDTYAHSAEIHGKRINHDNGADNVEYVYQRYDDACSVARQMMNRYSNKQALTAKDLVMPGNYTYNYELVNYSSYIQEVDSSITNYSYGYGSK